MRPCSRRIVLLSCCLVPLLSGCGGGGDDGGGANDDPPVAQRGTVQLGAGATSVDEGAGSASLTVTRTGGGDGAVSVIVASTDETAAAGQDYAATVITVTFADGDSTAKSITIPIINDSSGEDEETLRVTLSTPTGGAQIGALANTTITVHDDDAPNAPALAVGADIRQLVFSWQQSPGATRYRLWGDPDGASGYTQIGSDLDASATLARLDVSVHRHDWPNARYRLDACNSFGCSTSAPIDALGAMVRAIGYFKASNTGAGDEFGAALALSADGNTLAVAASAEASGAIGNQQDESAEVAGAVYVYARTQQHGWQQQAYLKATDPDRLDRFGSSIALSADGTLLAVGVRGDDSGNSADPTDNTVAGAGAVYLFAKADDQWVLDAYLKASNLDEGDLFGYAVALSSDGATLAVGAPGESSNATDIRYGAVPEDNNAAPRSGAVYIFRRADQWLQHAYIKAPNAQREDDFGRALALSEHGDTLLVGAPLEDGNGTSSGNNDSTDAGAAYVFFRDGDLWMEQAYLKASNVEPLTVPNLSEDNFGASVSISADGNVLTVSSPFESGAGAGLTGEPNSNDAPKSGAVYVFERSGADWAERAYLKASNSQAFDGFGSVVALSADGRTLVATSIGEDGSGRGAAPDDELSAGSGAVYVFERSDTGWLYPKYLKASNTDPGDEFGGGLALSADGSALAVGARGESSEAIGVDADQTGNAAADSGAVYLY